MISFCILHHDRLDCLKKCIESIEKHCGEPYEVLVLNQGVETPEILSYLHFLETRKNYRIVFSKENVGCPSGRKLLIKLAKGDYIATLDDDIYLRADSVSEAMFIFEASCVGVVGWPQYKPDDSFISWSAANITIKNGVLKVVKHKESYGMVDFVSGGCQIFRKELTSVFEWDGQYKMGFGDLDKALQVLKDGKWLQTVAWNSGVIHDHSTDTIEYKSKRYDYKVFSESYRKFINKWNLRYSLKLHLVYKYMFYYLPAKWLRWLK